VSFPSDRSSPSVQVDGVATLDFLSVLTLLALLLCLVGHVQTLLERLDSKEWLVVCEALTHTRQLSIFHSELLVPIL
jgi:hypothetical protein